MKKTIVTVVFEFDGELTEDETLHTISEVVNKKMLITGETYNVVDIDVIEE